MEDLFKRWNEHLDSTRLRVRGQRVKIDADSLNIFLETPVVLEEGETSPT